MMKTRRSEYCSAYLILFAWFFCDIWSIQLRSTEYIKNRLSLTSIVDKITSVDPASGLCLCPFHDDKSPSMKVNEGPGYYYCFACGESGNVVKFIAKMLNSSYDEATEHCLRIINEEQLNPDQELEKLFRASHVTMIRSTQHLTPKTSRILPLKIVPALTQVSNSPLGNREIDNSMQVKKETILSLLRLANSFFMTRLFVDPDATEVRNYLKSRGISVATAMNFQLGYAPRGRSIARKMQFVDDHASNSSSSFSSNWSLWDDLKYHSLTSWITNRALVNETDPSQSLGELVAAGLAINASQYNHTIPTYKSGSNPIYDRFRHRLMIPIRDIRGDIIGFGGRELPETSTNYSFSIKKIKSPGKYINTPTSAVFIKKETLFGADIAAQYQNESSYVFLVEGYFDVIALHEIGIKNAVASMGTSLSLQQLSLASKLSTTGTVILLFDQDAAGLKALTRMEELLEKYQRKHRSLSNIVLDRLTVKAGSLDHAVEFLREKYLENEEVMKKLGKIKDCADLILATEKSVGKEAMNYLANCAVLKKSI